MPSGTTTISFAERCFRLAAKWYYGQQAGSSLKPLTLLGARQRFDPVSGLEFSEDLI